MIKLSSNPPVLKESEMKVLQLLAGGKTSKAISDELLLSHRTIETKISVIRVKFGAKRFS
jgi:DNA-binding CsgD family transcriptional regulator